MPHRTVKQLTRLAPRLHVLYRLYDEYDQLLYVGRTSDLVRRLNAHSHEQPWWSQVDDCRTELYSGLHNLLAAERQAIATEHPKYNIVGVSDAEWDRRREIAEYNARVALLTPMIVETDEQRADRYIGPRWRSQYLADQHAV